MPEDTMASEASVAEWQERLDRLTPPANDEEARQLVQLLGPDDFFGLGFVIRRFVETAAGWPIWSSLTGSGPSIDDLRQRALNAGFRPPSD